MRTSRIYSLRAVLARYCTARRDSLLVYAYLPCLMYGIIRVEVNSVGQVVQYIERSFLVMQISSIT